MILFAAALACPFALRRGLRPTSNPRLFLEVLAITRGAILRVWACWALSWWSEQHW
jgi:hypothetical protein